LVFGVSPGFFGKSPAVGDFVSRRLPRNFLDPWDQWLQGAIASSQEQLGDSWLDNYLTSPIWRFALSAGVAGPLPYNGIMMPSVDRAGRYFPFTLASLLPVNTNLFQVARDSHAWYEAAEAVAISILEEEPPDIESLDSQVEALGLLIPVGADETDGKPADSGEAGIKPWHVPMQSVTGLLDTLPVMMQWLTEKRFGAYSLWWSAGSEHITPAMLVCEGLPPVKGYAAMLGGGWEEYGWDDLPAVISAAEHESEAAESCP
jgi:type VI secretion system protein ImpM